MSSFQVASQRGRRSDVGWLGEGLSQSPLFSVWWSRADFIEWSFKLPSIDFPAEEAKSDSHAASQRDALFRRECFAVESSKVLHVCAPRHVRTRSFSDCRVLQGDGLKSRSFTGVRHSDSMLWRSWRTHNLFQVSLRWHVEPGDTASAADLPHPWKLFCVQSLHDLFLPCCK